MPFNASGVFERVYDWTTDRDNGTKILAARMDTETDGIVAAINDIVGQSQGFTGAVKGTNGTAASPAYSFTDDPDSGMYRVSADKVGFSVNGTLEMQVEAGFVDAVNGLKIGGTEVTASATEINLLDGYTGILTSGDAFSDSDTKLMTAAAIDDRINAVGGGSVDGPGSATDSNFAAFDGTTGDLIKDSGKSASDFATAAQGAKADTATQPGDLATVATSGDYDDLTNKPTLGTAAASDTGDFATAAQGTKADAAIPDPASPVAGDLLISNGTSWNRLGIGTAGQALVVNSGATAPEWGSAGGMEFVETVDCSNDANAQFTGFDSSKYDAYKIIATALIPATDNVSLYMRTSTDGGSTFDSGGSDYQYRANAIPMAALLGSGIVGPAAQITLDYTTIGSAAGEYGISFEMTVLMPHLAVPTLFTWQGAYQDTAGSWWQIQSSVGVRAAAEAVNAIGFFFSSGNIESGSITLWGLKNS